MIRIGNGQGFWGDRSSAPAELLQLQPDIDFLTLDYLAEISLSIMAVQREKNPSLGYAPDFLDVLLSLIPFWKQGSSVKVIANAGGLNPRRCAEQCGYLLRQSGLQKKIGVVFGDDVKKILLQDPENTLFRNLDTNASFATVSSQCVSANAYFGAQGIAEVLRQGADIVITGRSADPSLTVGACMAHFGWEETEYQKIAAATIAGHIIECGTQATGGISTDWLSVPDPASMGYPIVEMEESGLFTVTKPEQTGGMVNRRMITEQLLYELGDPDHYLSPDVTVSLLNLKVQEEGPNRVRIEGALGRPPTDTYKVNAAYRNGYRAEGMLALYGRDLSRKGRRCGEMVLKRLEREGFVFERSRIECIGLGDVVPNVSCGFPSEPLECMLRIAVADQRQEAVERFCKEIAPLVTSGPQGITGYTTGRPKPRQVFGFWPCLIKKEQAPDHIEIWE